MNTAGPYSASAMRASDADRDGVLAELSENFRAGRLTSDELEERSGQALRARTYGDLAHLTADLPSPAATTPAAGPAASLATRPGWAKSPALVSGVLALAVVTAVLGTLMGTGNAGRVASLWWLVFVPLAALRMLVRGRR